MERLRLMVALVPAKTREALPFWVGLITLRVSVRVRVSVPLVAETVRLYEPAITLFVVVS